MIGMGEALRRISDTPRRPFAVMELGDDSPSQVTFPVHEKAVAPTTPQLDWTLLESLSVEARAPQFVDCVELALPEVRSNESAAQFSVQILPGEAALAPETPPTPQVASAVEVTDDTVPPETIEIDTPAVETICDPTPAGSAEATDAGQPQGEVSSADQEFLDLDETSAAMESTAQVETIIDCESVEIVDEPPYALTESVIDPSLDTEHEYELEPATVPPPAVADDELFFELETQAAAVALEPIETNEFVSQELATEELAAFDVESDWNRLEAALDSVTRLADEVESGSAVKVTEARAELAPTTEIQQFLPGRQDLPSAQPTVIPRPDAAAHALADYRRLRDNILTQFPPRAPLSIALVSVNESPEHSRLAAHLAQVLAERDAGDVLAVDADLLHPGLADELFDESIDIDAIIATQGASFAALLHQERTVDEVAVATSYPKVWAIPGNLSPFDELGARDSFRVDPLLLLHCKQLFPQVLLSAGSIESRTAIPLARQCDAAYLVVDLGRTGRQAAVEALARLELGGVRVLGCVLTGAPVN